MLGKFGDCKLGKHHYLTQKLKQITSIELPQFNTKLHKQNKICEEPTYLESFSKCEKDMRDFLKCLEAGKNVDYFDVKCSKPKFHQKTCTWYKFYSQKRKILKGRHKHFIRQRAYDKLELEWGINFWTGILLPPDKILECSRCVQDTKVFFDMIQRHRNLSEFKTNMLFKLFVV